MECLLPGVLRSRGKEKEQNGLTLSFFFTRCLLKFVGFVCVCFLSKLILYSKQPLEVKILRRQTAAENCIIIWTFWKKNCRMLTIPNKWQFMMQLPQPKWFSQDVVDRPLTGVDKDTGTVHLSEHRGGLWLLLI